MSGTSYGGLEKVWGGLGGKGEKGGKGHDDRNDKKGPKSQQRGPGKALYAAPMKPSSSMFAPFSWMKPKATATPLPLPTPAVSNQNVTPIFEAAGRPALPNRYVMSTDVTEGVPQPASVVQQTTVPAQPATTQIMQPVPQAYMMPPMQMMQMPQQTQAQPMRAPVQPIAPIAITPQQARLGAIASAAAAALFFL